MREGLGRLLCAHRGTETIQETTDNGRVVTVVTRTKCLRCGKALPPRAFWTPSSRVDGDTHHPDACHAPCCDLGGYLM